MKKAWMPVILISIIITLMSNPPQANADGFADCTNE